VTVPLHADAPLDVGYRDPSANLTGDCVGGGGGGVVVVKDSSGGVVVVRPLADPAVVLEFDLASGAGALPPPTRAIADDRRSDGRPGRVAACCSGGGLTRENGADGEERRSR
jgi:hypothetical protein